MIIDLLRSYPKLEDGHIKLDRNHEPIIVFVYAVKGTPKELDEYESIQKAEGVKTIVDEDGTYLWFTTRPVGVKGKLVISPKGKIFADTTALDLANAMIRQHGALGRILAPDILAEGFEPKPPAKVADPKDTPLDID